MRMKKTDVETRVCIVFSYIIYAVLTAIALQPANPPKYNQFESVDWLREELFKFPSSAPVVFICAATCAFVATVVFILGELTGNVSQVDKLWSILPVLYVWEVTYLRPNPRTLLMTFAATVWGVRLTYNFARRGGYGWPFWKGEEDYRWFYVRKLPVLNTRLGWSLFNLLFISIYQNILLFLTASPVVVCSVYDRPVSVLDYLLTASLLMLVIIEYLTDQQQYDFQEKKWSMIRKKEKLYLPYSIGFPCHGLFSISRHANYVAEISFWFFFYLYTVLGGARWMNWTLSGSVLLCLLFQGSTALMESITSKKYPLYSRYKKMVPRFLGIWNPFQTSFPSVLADGD